MQTVKSLTTEEKHQLVVDEFQQECLESLYNDRETRADLKQFVIDHQPFNGLILITKPTRTYIKYLRSKGFKVDKHENLLSYTKMSDFIDANRNLSPAMAATLSEYNSLPQETKNSTFLFMFQVPYSYDPSRSLQNFDRIDDLNL